MPELCSKHCADMRCSDNHHEALLVILRLSQRVQNVAYDILYLFPRTRQCPSYAEHQASFIPLVSSPHPSDLDTASHFRSHVAAKALTGLAHLYLGT
jgi:hypothetical protein